MEHQDNGPYIVDGYPAVPHQTVGDARIYAGHMQLKDHRSMQIRDRHGSVVDMKRF